LERVFTPRSVAIAGSTPRQPAEQILETLVASGFQGRIHLVNGHTEEASGRKVYHSVAEIPGPVDYLACCTPAAEVLPLLRECAARQVGAVAILTGGFAESGTQRGVRLEQEISALARETGLRVMGPNCLGVYCPRGGMSFDRRLPAESGRMGFIGQGREPSVRVLRAAGHRGVRFSKAISYGNACDIGESELLEYFAQDGDTDAVAACIESVRDGPRFFRILQNLSEVKPVILMKTAPTSGKRNGINSVQAGDGNPNWLWSALLQQTGAVGVSSAEDMVDTMVAFAMMPRPRGRRLGIFGGAGGASVLATDAWAIYGFVLPPVPPQLREKLDAGLMNQAGMMLHNPLDFSMAMSTEFMYDVTTKMMMHEDFVDIGVIHNPTGQGAWLAGPAFDAGNKAMASAAISIHRAVNKPLVIVMHYIDSRPHWQGIFRDLQEPCSEAGVPVYYSMASAARAIDRMLRYYERRSVLAETV